MTAFEEYFEKATAPGPNRQLPGCVVIAANKGGKCGVPRLVGARVNSRQL